MAQAKEALELLSRDPTAEALAEARQKGEVYRRLDMTACHQQGLAEGVREAIAAVADLLGVELSPERSARLAAADVAELRDLLQRLRETRSWPD